MINKKIYAVILIINFLISVNGENNAIKAGREANKREALIDSLSHFKIDSLVISRDSVSYAADSMHYDSSQEEILFWGNATVNYSSSSLFSDSLRVKTKDKKIKSSGPARLEDAGIVVLGENIYFDVESKTGKVKNGAAKFEQGYCYGKEIRKVGDKTADLDDGIFTSCDAEEPHYWISSNQMRIFKGDKVVLRPIIFNVNHIPIFILPYGAFSIQRERKNGFLIPRPGYTSGEGKIIENIGYYWHCKNYADNTLWFDFYEKTGWIFASENTYKKRYEFNGRNRYKYRKQIRKSGGIGYNWEIYSRHHHEFFNDRKLDMTLHFVSNKSIYENNEDINEELRESVSSDIYFKMPLFGNTLSFSSNYKERLNKDSRDLTLPKISWTMGLRPITEFFTEKGEDKENFSDDFSVSLRFGASHKADIDSHNPDFADIFYKLEKDSLGTGYINNHVYGLGLSETLTWSRKFAGWLNLSNSTTSKQIYLYRDRQDNYNATAYDYSNSSKASFNVYGTRYFEKWKLKALRHIVTPSVSFKYSPDFSYHQNKYYNAGGFTVNSGKKSRKISMSLGQKWQIKWQKKDGKILKMNSLLSMNSSSSYDLENEKWSNLRHRVTLKPNKNSYKMMEYQIKLSGDLNQFSKTMHVKSWGFDVSLDMSGITSHKTYFPIKKNQFTSGKFILSDSLTTEIDQQEDITDLKDYDKKNSEQNWTWNISCNLSRTKTNDSPDAKMRTESSMRSNLNFKLTKNWSLQYAVSLDMRKGDIQSETYRITRDMHCWKLRFDVTKRPGYWSYKFEFVNIKINDLKFSQSGRKH